jgi:hypothetical protein
VKPYPLVNDIAEPALRVAMPRAPRLVAPGGTVHVVSRCNNREFSFTTPEDFAVLLAHLHELVRTYEVTLYVPVVELCGLRRRGTQSGNHVPFQLPRAESLCESLPAAVPHAARPERRSPGRCPRSPLDYPAGGGEPCIHGALPAR